MKLSWRLAAIPVVCLVMSGCHSHLFGGGKAPSGQVAATVNGEEITQLELNAELAGVNLPADPKARKAVETRALQAIIGRVLLAQAARNQGLGKTPEFAMQKARADEVLLGQALQSKLAKAVPPPTSEEVSKFILDNPDLFDQRKIFTVDQIRVAQPSDPDFMKKIQPLNTMADVEALLASEHLDYRRGTAQLDADGADPRMIAAVVKLPPNTVFVMAGGGGLLVNQITDTKIQPLTGGDATKYATALLTRQHVQEALSRQVKTIFSKGAASVRYNPAYQPPQSYARAAAISSAPEAASSTPVSSESPTNN